MELRKVNLLCTPAMVSARGINSRLPVANHADVELEESVYGFRKLGDHVARAFEPAIGSASLMMAMVVVGIGMNIDVIFQAFECNL